MHKLEYYLKEKNLTKTEFAERVGIHLSYITHLVKGRRVPSLSVALKIQDLTDGEVPVTTWVMR